LLLRISKLRYVGVGDKQMRKILLQKVLKGIVVENFEFKIYWGWGCLNTFAL
jgi:hypothetical protein